MPRAKDIADLTESTLRKALRDDKATVAERLDAVRLGLVWMKIKASAAQKAGGFFDDDPDDGSNDDGKV